MGFAALYPSDLLSRQGFSGGDCFAPDSTPSSLAEIGR